MKGDGSQVLIFHLPSVCLLFAGRSKGWGIVEFETPEEVGLWGYRALLMAVSIGTHQSQLCTSRTRRVVAFFC